MVKETLSRSPEKGFGLRIVLDLTPEETAAEVRAREEQIRQLQVGLGTLRELEERQKRLLKVIGV